MNLTGDIILLLIKYSYWVVLACALLGGEELIVFFSILAGHGFINIGKVAIYGFIGILLSDIFWFWIARAGFVESLKQSVKRHYIYKHANAVIERFSHKHDLIYLASTKFLYGLRIISIVKVSRRGSKFWDFVLNDSLAILIWGSIMLTIGWVVGKTFFTTINLFDEIHKIIILALGLIAVLYVAESIVKKSLQKR